MFAAMTYIWNMGEYGAFQIYACILHVIPLTVFIPGYDNLKKSSDLQSRSQ